MADDGHVTAREQRSAMKDSVMPVHVEFRLDWLIEGTGISQPSPFRRLNAIENLMTLMVRRWRTVAPISPARDLRMARETANALVRWTTASEAAAGETLERLAVYASGAMESSSVPVGWVRLTIVAPG